MKWPFVSNKKHDRVVAENERLRRRINCMQIYLGATPLSTDSEAVERQLEPGALVSARSGLDISTLGV